MLQWWARYGRNRICGGGHVHYLEPARDRTVRIRRVQHARALVRDDDLLEIRRQREGLEAHVECVYVSMCMWLWVCAAE